MWLGKEALSVDIVWYLKNTKFPVGIVKPYDSSAKLFHFKCKFVNVNELCKINRCFVK